MYIIEGIGVTEDLFTTQFLCNLKACRGACCVEGDNGAPVLDIEIETLKEIQEEIRQELTKEGKKALKEQWVAVGHQGKWSTPLIDGGPCAYVDCLPPEVVRCGIEKAWSKGKINFQKPLSCHLYPVRVRKDFATGLDILYYDQWDICQPACVCGVENKLPLFRFVKDALIRGYGTKFYEGLEYVYSTLE
jgi:hypothetical protein